MQTLSRKQEMKKIANLKLATFPLLIVRFVFKTKRAEAVDEIDKLCKFH